MNPGASRAWSEDAGTLVCPVCRAPLSILEADGDQGVFGHAAGNCGAVYPVIDRIPRLVRGDARRAVVAAHRDWFGGQARRDRFADWVQGPSDPTSLRVVERFDKEWAEFHDMETTERSRVFDAYFDLLPDRDLAGAMVLDAGCGSGRWSRELNDRGARVVAMDLGTSIDVAAGGQRRSEIAFVQADVVDAPFQPGTFDLVCSLGVLHHVVETEKALSALASTIRPGGHLLLYVYYALDQRPAWYKLLYRISDVARMLLSALPQGATRVITALLAGLIYWPLARLSGALDRAGLRRAADAVPLAFYRHLSFRTMRNDSLDRFGTPLEKRFTRSEVIEMMTAAGLTDIRVSPNVPYWHAVGARR